MGDAAEEAAADLFGFRLDAGLGGSGLALPLAGTSPRAIGLRTMNSAPRFRPSLRASSAPPCLETRLRTTASPIPNPPYWRRQLASTWVYGSKMLDSIWLGIPMPVSLTVRIRSRPSLRACTEISPAFSV